MGVRDDSYRHHGSKQEKKPNEEQSKTGQNSPWLWRCVLRHLAECQVLFLSETSKIFEESRVFHSKVGAAQKKNPSMPKRKIRVAQKKPRGGSGWRLMLAFFWSWHVCKSSPKMFQKFFCSQKMDFATFILWKSVRSTLIFLPPKIQASLKQSVATAWTQCNSVEMWVCEYVLWMVPGGI